MDIIAKLAEPGAQLLGTWVKLSTLETMEMLGHAGFDAVVIDTEHGSHGHETVYRLIFAAQAMGMAALVRVPDRSGSDIQRVLDAGADGILVPRVQSLDEVRRVGRHAMHSPGGDRGLGSTSRAGRWGMVPMADYIERGRSATLRMIQLEDWDALEQVEAVVDVTEINGIFLGLADLMLSSGKPPSDPAVQALVDRAFRAATARGIPCGIAVGSGDEAKRYLDRGFKLVMVGNDCTMFGRAAAALVTSARGG